MKKVMTDLGANTQRPGRSRQFVQPDTNGSFSPWRSGRKVVQLEARIGGEEGESWGAAPLS